MTVRAPRDDAAGAGRPIPLPGSRTPSSDASAVAGASWISLSARRRGRPAGSVDRHGVTLPVLSEAYCHDHAALVIGEAIRATREAMNVSAEELADRLELHTSTVLKWERGEATPHVKHLVRAAQALGTTASALIEGA